MTLTNADLAERLGVIARNLNEHGRSFGDDLTASDLTAIHETIAAAAARLGMRRVVIRPDTALVVSRGLQIAADHAEPYDADAWHALARTIAAAAERDTPDPHVSIATDDGDPGDPDRVLRISLAVEITGDWVNPDVIAYTARTLAAQLSNSLRADADEIEEDAEPASTQPGGGLGPADLAEPAGMIP